MVETYESEGVHDERGDGVGQSTEAKDVKVHTGHDEIPEKVTRRQGLDHRRALRVGPHSLLPAHAPPLLVVQHDPDGEAVDEQALHHGHDVGVPIDAPPAGEAVVRLGGEVVGYERGYGPEDDGVEQRGAEDLVDVPWQGGQVEGVGPRLGGLDEP